MINNTEYKFSLEDCTSVKYELPKIIENHFSDIMDAHAASAITNNKMIRLDGFKKEDNKITLYTSRTFFFYDLVTNRAMDYKFKNDLTIRQIFESDEYLSELEHSRMSNHIGINALVVENGELLLPVRDGESTLSKNKITSTIAIGLSLEKVRMCSRNSGESSPTLTIEQLQYEIVEKLTKQLYEGEDVAIKVSFLGFGRLLYTGGKPQFYYVVYVENKEKNKLEQKSKRIEKIREINGTIDGIKNIKYAKSIELKSNNKYKVIIEESDVKKSRCTFEVEKSFLVNLWHWNQYDDGKYIL